MYPRLMMAGLVIWSQAAQLFGMDPGLHNGVGPGGVAKAQSENTSSIVLILSRLRQRQAVPLKSPATKSMS